MEEFCAKAVEQISQTWGALIDDEDLQKFREPWRTVETEVNQNGMKKLLLAEKMAKAAEMKKLQQQVATLQTL